MFFNSVSIQILLSCILIQHVLFAVKHYILISLFAVKHCILIYCKTNLPASVLPPKNVPLGLRDGMISKSVKKVCNSGSVSFNLRNWHSQTLTKVVVLFELLAFGLSVKVNFVETAVRENRSFGVSVCF